MDWLEKALVDYRSAEILFAYEGDYGIVAFHCQQAIEKLFKAYILKQAKELIEGHSLVFLCRKAGEYDPLLNNFLKKCAFVNQFYIESRYPADIPMAMEKSEAQECIDIADALLKHIKLI
jgi:HEPN domain-containing protein